jgi:NADPH-dependent 2,4-dienoyl-CoA reductase/sulfur reductase-like enzyme
MEAARVLALRGFGVTLFERGPALGGMLNLAGKPPHKEMITKLVKSMALALEKLGVDVRLNTSATPELARSLSPIGVFVAAGAVPIVPNLPGADGPCVCTAESVIAGTANPSGRVAIIGTGLTGLETADLLIERGCEITLVEMQNEIGPGLFPVIRNDIMSRVGRGSPKIFKGHRLVSIRKDGEESEICLQNGDGEKTVGKADFVVLALGLKPETDVVGCFEEEFGSPSVFAIGNASRMGRIYEAIRDGFDKAFVFEPA